jgi:hypothetical protein
LDSIAVLQDNIVRVSLHCVQAETQLAATSRRLQQLERDIDACVAGASDADSLDDRKAYYDAVRKMWVDKALLQKDELRMLEQLRKQLDAKSKLRAQLLDKQQTLLTLGLTVRDYTVYCTCLQRIALLVSLRHVAALATHLPMPRQRLRVHVHGLHCRVASTSRQGARHRAAGHY